MEDDNKCGKNFTEDGPPNMINESSKVSVSSINELKNGFNKRLLSDEVSSVSKKKVKLIENCSSSDEETEITSLNISENPKKEDHVKELMEKLRKFADSPEVDVPNGLSQINTKNDHSDDVSNKSPKKISKNNDLNKSIETLEESNDKDNSNHSHDDVNDISTRGQKVNSPSKKSNCEEDITSNENNLSTAEIEENSENEFVQNDHNNSPLNSPSPDKLVIVENVDDNDDNDDETSSQAADKNATSVNDEVESNINAEITNEAVKSLPEPSSNSFHHINSSLMESSRKVEKSNNSGEDDCLDNKEFKIIESENDLTTSANEINLDDQKIIDDIIKGLAKLSSKSYPYLINTIFKEVIVTNKLESLCWHKVLEYWAEKSKLGKFREDSKEILEKEKYWRKKYSLIYKQFRELKTIVKIHINDLKIDPNAKPHIITRTVGLQATMCPNKSGYTQQKKVTVPPIIDPPISGSVDISDDEIANISDTEGISGDENVSLGSPQPSCSKNPGNIIQKKQSPSIEKAKPTSIPPDSNFISNVTIDLTGNDDIDVEESPTKTVRQHSTMNTSIPNQMTSNLPTQVSVPTSIAYIELPTSSSFIMRTASSTRPNQLGTISNLSPTNKDKNNGRLVYASGKILPLHPLPVLNSNLVQKPVQVSQTLTPIQVGQNLTPVSTVHVGQSLKPIPAGSLKPVKSIQPSVAYTTHKLSPGSQINGLLQPVPAAIPILKHPAPLPSAPIQKINTNSLKKKPPAPTLSLSKDTKSSPTKALVLSWNMNLNKSHADISSYQIYSYQELATETPRSELWKQIGNVNALPVPMACSLTQFSLGERYHFAVRAIDTYNRCGPFSAPKSIDLI